jgi:hypothetical protein
MHQFLGSYTNKEWFFEIFYFLVYSGKAEPQCPPVAFGSPHEAICAVFVDMYLPILHSY